MAHDVFISYSSKDKPLADALCASLESAQIRCWIAPRDIIPGQNWGEAIIDAIEGSRVMVLVFSSHANESVQIQREVERAVHKGVPIVPFRIENVEPAKSLEYFLSTPHWLDAITPPIEDHLRFLTETVQRLLGQEVKPPIIVKAAPKNASPALDRLWVWIKIAALLVLLLFLVGLGVGAWKFMRYMMAGPAGDAPTAAAPSAAPHETPRPEPSRAASSPLRTAPPATPQTERQPESRGRPIETPASAFERGFIGVWRFADQRAGTSGAVNVGPAGEYRAQVVIEEGGRIQPADGGFSLTPYTSARRRLASWREVGRGTVTSNLIPGHLIAQAAFPGAVDRFPDVTEVQWTRRDGSTDARALEESHWEGSISVGPISWSLSFDTKPGSRYVLTATAEDHGKFEARDGRWQLTPMGASALSGTYQPLNPSAVSMKGAFGGQMLWRRE